MTKKIRSNPKMTELELLKMLHNGTLDNYMRKHNLTRDKCPPYKLIASDQQCCYCISCFNYCLSQIKELKDSYKIGKVIYKKEELDDSK